MPPSQIDSVIYQLKRAKNDITRLRVIERFLLNHLNQRANLELISVTVGLIKKYAGDIKITVLAEKVHISQSQLEKRFRKVVGASPKKFASIVRLRKVLDVAASQTSMTKLGLEAGYFDQAHFIKDFKSFTGTTPEQFFKANKINDFLQLQV